jgi:Ca-activated chloride channel family protein
MPSFSQPWFLLLLALIPPVVRRWLHRPRPAMRLPDLRVFAGLPTGRAALARRAGIAARTLALVCVVLALAGLRWPDERTLLPTRGIAIGMVVDVSGSMAEEDFQWQGKAVSRLTAVKNAFRLFVAGGEGPDGARLDGRPADLIGLVAFASRPDAVCPLTLSHGVLLQELDRLEPRTITGQMETNIGDALALSLERLRQAGPQHKVLVLLTDGEDTPGLKSASGWKPRQPARAAASLKIPIYTIDAGVDPPTPLEGGTREDAEGRAAGIRTLEEIARISGGQYFRAKDSQTLLDVCRKIDGLERDPIQTFQHRRYYEAFSWLAVTAFVLLTGIHALELTVWQRLP